MYYSRREVEVKTGREEFPVKIKFLLPLFYFSHVNTGEVLQYESI